MWTQSWTIVVKNAHIYMEYIQIQKFVNACASFDTSILLIKLKRCTTSTYSNSL
jgi:hypothetical protein